MYASKQEPQNVTLQDQTAALEDSIQAMLSIVGPTQVERKIKLRRIDILTTPVQFRIISAALLAAQQAVDAAAAGFQVTDAINVETQG